MLCGAVFHIAEPRWLHAVHFIPGFGVSSDDVVDTFELACLSNVYTYIYIYIYIYIACAFTAYH